MDIKKDDQVKILAGKDKGKIGKVVRAFPREGKVSVSGINLYKKRVRPKTQNQKGETVEVARPVDRSNVMLVCPNCKKPTKVGYRMESDKKVRYCKKCGSVI